MKIEPFTPEKPKEPFDWQPWAVRIAVAILIVTFCGAAWWEMKERSANIRQYAARQIEIRDDVKWIRNRLERGERTGR